MHHVLTLSLSKCYVTNQAFFVISGTIGRKGCAAACVSSLPGHGIHTNTIFSGTTMKRNVCADLRPVLPAHL